MAYTDFEEMKATFKPLSREDIIADTAEYRHRIRTRQPVSAPRFKVGDWVYSGVSKGNVKVVHVGWDSSPFSGRSFWRVSVPGVNGDECNFGYENPNLPYLHYERVDTHSWKHVRTTKTSEENV